ncbi:hypothetical protein [Macrococcoides caseolyticum]|uniref:Uncharacterized protein n=1 Tax=Macrococcoides caseolyticum TaxID=69966 RepID=A0ACC9MTB8_9STAP|nr:hypothetical protein [Macrococcus caseolyticus]PKE39538.1 hypothetical protein CW675_06235 [Macrococcus caseolyticus]PKE56751.1 hypothetical protein CW682_04360 [Macrococcus caseolyticus]
MIKAGDKVILDGVEYVIKEIKGNDVLLVKRDNALNIVFVNEKTLYAKLYEQQKQRADELEKRWSELETKLKDKYNYLKLMSEKQSFGHVEQSKWNAGKHEVLMVLKLMTDLKRGETE